MKAPAIPAQQTLLEKWLSRGIFLLRKFVTGFRVADEPHLDELASAHFKEVLARTSHYLEYGCGSSTIWAWQAAKTVVTVDNDRRYLRAVTKALLRLEVRPALSSLMHVNTGVTKRWGIPLFKAATPRRLRQWQRYAPAPWDFFKAHSIEPDTILIDGRFRVACVLESLTHLGANSSCTILLDDYVERPEYAVVEAFADRVSMHGKLAVLRKKPDFDRAECLRLLPQFHRDWR